MACPKCGATAAENQLFCEGCGSSLRQTCLACGSDLRPGSRFCSHCGAAVGNRRPFAAGGLSPATDDRRQLTVVFVDLVGSTALSEKIDAEDLRDVIAAYHAVIIEAAASYGGFVARYFGDGVLLYFGHPRAHEDDPERAVQFALEAIVSIDRLETAAGPRGTLHVRVGIATGQVVIATIGEGTSEQVSAVGETPNLAARLQALAQPGTIVVSDETRRLTGRLFEYADLGAVRLKGLRGPVRAWTVIGRGETESRFEALRHAQRPLVNRQDEFALLKSQWRIARNGSGRTILLSGEAGIGKSRLVSAFERSTEQPDRNSLHIGCSSYHAHTPLYPVIRYFERMIGTASRDSPALQQSGLARFGAARGMPEQDLALLANLLSIPWPGQAHTEDLPPRQRREKTLAAIVRYITTLAEQAPLLVAIEDFHWADPTTTELLGMLIDVVEGKRIMLLITMRPSVPPRWASRPDVMTVMLNGFTRKHARELVGNLVLDKILPSDVVDRIISHSDGVPLFIEELTTSVLENQILRDRISSPAELPLPVSVVPDSLQASLLERLDRHLHLKEITQIASVIGREFSLGMLEKVSQLNREPLELALDDLVRAEVILALGRASDAVFSFKHALLQDAAYGSMLRDRRRQIHRRVAEVLRQDEIGQIESAPQIIAWHFGESGDPDHAIEYYLKATESATGRSALAEIVNYLRSGLQQAGNLPASPYRQQRELRLQVALGRALIDHLGSGSDQVRVAFERARELGLELQETDRLLQIHDGLANHYITRSQPEQVLHYATELLEIGRQTGNLQAFLIALRSQGFAHLLLGRLVEANDAFRQLLQLYDFGREGPRALVAARDPKVSSSTLFAICLTTMGHADAGMAMSAEAVEYAETLGHVVSMVLGLRRACVQCMVQRDASRALQLSERLLATNSEHEIFLATREGGIFQSWARLCSVPNKDEQTRLLACLDELDQAKHWLLLPFFMTCAAERLGWWGDRDGARALLKRAATLAGNTEERWCMPEIMRVQALYSDANPDGREGLLLESIALAREQGAKLWELRSSVTLSALWRDQGKRDAARSLLHPVRAWFTEGFATPDVQEADRVLASLD